MFFEDFVIIFFISDIIYLVDLIQQLWEYNFSNINFDKKEILSKTDKRLRETDEEYRTSIVNMAKYKTVLLTTAMITELAPEDQNKVIIFLLNFYNI